MTTERIANHVQFAYWVPNVNGGLVTSDIEQRTDWGYHYNVKLAQTPSTSASPPASAWLCCWPRSGSR